MTLYVGVGITDHFSPEVQAMLLAKYSREFAPIEYKLPTTEEGEDSLKERLRKYYVGWNHKSVGQLGVTTIFIEGVSLLCAKVIEDNPLFNGQESSTRYIPDFATQPMVIPNNSMEISNWQEIWRAFYVRALPLVIAKIELEFPFEENLGTYHHKENIDKQRLKAFDTWKNTVKARAFDICRGFLPAGVTTNVGFIGSFDTLNDHFGQMLHHPCQEMRDVAAIALDKLMDKYPHAAISKTRLFDEYAYMSDAPLYYYNPPFNTKILKGGKAAMEVFNHTLPPTFATDGSMFNLPDRKRGQQIPKYLSKQISLKVYDQIDFGSWRDLARHRPGYCPMPVLTPNKGMNEFYMDQLTPELLEEATKLLSNFAHWFEKTTRYKQLTNILKDFQYAVPIGYNVQTEYTCDVNQMLYVMELRSGKTVHQTLRLSMHRWYEQFKLIFPNLKVHIDESPDNFTLKRGTQTINKPADE